MLVHALAILVSKTIQFSFQRKFKIYPFQVAVTLSDITDCGRCEVSFLQDRRKQTADAMSGGTHCTQMFSTSFPGSRILSS